MSNKINNNKANVKNISKVSKIEADKKSEIEELESKIEKMKEDKNAKCKAAKDQLISQLEITVDKYRTATGTAEALRVLHFILGDNIPVSLRTANSIARVMAVETQEMANKAKSLNFNEMDKLCDEFYENDFTFEDVEDDVKEDDLVIPLAIEMMRIDLCRNVGSSAEDLVDFIKRTQDEIDEIGKRLKELNNS